MIHFFSVSMIVQWATKVMTPASMYFLYGSKSHDFFTYCTVLAYIYFIIHYSCVPSMPVSFRRVRLTRKRPVTNLARFIDSVHGRCSGVPRTVLALPNSVISYGCSSHHFPSDQSCSVSHLNDILLLNFRPF